MKPHMYTHNNFPPHNKKVRSRSHAPKNARLRFATTQNSTPHTEMRNKKSALLPK